MSQTEQNIEYVKVSDLEPHQLNREIYTNRDISGLVEKIDRHGFQEEHELLITPDNKILSGHRRWRAARELGITEVPARRKDVDGDNALLTLLLANQYRDKTPAEKIREGEAWEKIKREDAKERMSEGGGVDKSTNPDKGPTREKVGEKIGVSGSTYERGKKVKEKANAGDEMAQKEWEKLKSGEQSINGAHSAIKKSENKTESEDGSSDTVENSWRSGRIESQDVQYRNGDSQDRFVLCLDGTDYNIQEDLLIELLA